MPKRFRPILFVCSGVRENGELISKIIQAKSSEEASNFYLNEYSLNPKEVFGPFYKKRVKIEAKKENIRTIKFSNQTKKAIYKDWIVNAFLLKDPENQAYLIFLKRVDGKKEVIPKGIITVPISELKDLTNE